MSAARRREPCPIWVPPLVGALVVLVVVVAMAGSARPWTLTMDTGRVFLGQTVPAFRTWMDGRVPEWSDLLWGGFPLLGDCTTAALYPLHLVAWYASVDHPLRFFDVAFALHLGLFAAGASALLRVLGAGWAAVVFGGVLAALSPFAHYCGIAFFPVLGAQAWWPWALVAAERLARPETRALGGAMLLGWVAIAAQILVGVPEQATYSATLASAWLLTRRSGLPLVSRIGRLALLGAGAFALSAPQLLPTMAYLPLASRALRGGEIPSLWLSDPAQLFVAGAGVMNGVPSFLGLAALALTAIAVGARRPRAGFLLAAAVLTFALATGPQAGLYSWLHAVPPFDRFRSPIKLYAIAEFAVAWAAALGADALWRRRSASLRTAAVLLCVAALAERAIYLAPEAQAIEHLHEKMGLSPEMLDRLLRSVPVRTQHPAHPPNVAYDLSGMAGGGYTQSLGALVGLSSLRAGTVALVTADHLRLLNRRQPSTVLGMKYALVAADQCDRAQRRHRWPIVQRTRDFCVLMNSMPSARYSLIQNAVQVASIQEMVEHVRREPNGLVPVVVGPDAGVGRSGGDVRIRSYEAGDVVLETAPTAPALLLARESRLPGWDVRVDGVPADILPAAGLYFAVPIEPGHHTVTLRYRAPGFRAGLAVAGGWVALVLPWAVWSRRRRGAS